MVSLVIVLAVAARHSFWMQRAVTSNAARNEADGQKKADSPVQLHHNP